MKRLLIWAAIAGSLFFVQSAAKAEGPHETLTLMTTRDADMKSLSDVISDCDLKIVRDRYSTKGHFHVVSAEARKGTLSEAQRKLASKKNASIRCIEVTPMSKLEGPVIFPNDPYSTLQYNLPVMNFNTALKQLVAVGGHQRTNPHVTVIDTGVQIYQGELDQVTQYNFVGGVDGVSEAPFDSGIHGTGVSSIAACTTNNKTLIAGVGTNRLPVAVVSCRVSDDGDKIATLDVLDAIVWCIDNQVLRGGAGPINLSINTFQLPTYNSSPVVQAMALELRQQGDLLVNAAGNLGVEDPTPELYMRRVGATDQNNIRAPFSIFGPFFAYAPGVNVPLLFNTIHSVGFGSGTSFACPNWVGSIAFLQSLNPRLNAPQADSIIFDTASITSQGYHIPNYARAVPRALRAH